MLSQQLCAVPASLLQCSHHAGGPERYTPNKRLTFLSIPRMAGLLGFSTHNSRLVRPRLSSTLRWNHGFPIWLRLRVTNKVLIAFCCPMCEDESGNAGHTMSSHSYRSCRVYSVRVAVVLMYIVKKLATISKVPKYDVTQCVC